VKGEIVDRIEQVTGSRNQPKLPRVNPEIVHELIAAFQSGGWLETAGRYIQLGVIVDANVVISDLLWLSRKRRVPHALTMLQEVLTYKTVIATAPTHLDSEIESKLPVIAAKEGVPTDVLYQHWLEYKKLIQFEVVEEEPTDPMARDPKDIPYLRLHQKTKLPIYTRDADLAAMGAAVVSGELIVKMRDYTRHANVEFAVKFGLVTISGITAAMVAALWRALYSGLHAFKRLPPGAQLLIIAGVMVAICHPRTRALAIELARGIGLPLWEAIQPILEASEPYLAQYNAAAAQTAEIAHQLRSSIPLRAV
jgi:predicted nucleic acid-binding protein